MILLRWVMQQQKARSQSTQTTPSSRFLTECFSSLSMFVTRSHTNTLRGKSLCQLLDTFSTCGTASLYFHGDNEPNSMCALKRMSRKVLVYTPSHLRHTHGHLCPCAVCARARLSVFITHTSSSTHTKQHTYTHTQTSF